MARRPNSSRQTEALLAALLGDAPQWRHGYDVSGETGLKSGTLYPALMRLEQQGWLEARWEDEPTPGKPRRHLYRLTTLGTEQAQAILHSAAERHVATRPSPAPEGGDS